MPVGPEVIGYVGAIVGIVGGVFGVYKTGVGVGRNGIAVQLTGLKSQLQEVITGVAAVNSRLDRHLEAHSEAKI